MSTTITTYSDESQLAFAAYAVGLTQGMTKEAYKTALMANNSMTAIQADRFIARYEIIDSQQNTPMVSPPPCFANAPHPKL